MSKNPVLLYKTLAVGVIVLFVGVGIQPAIADVVKQPHIPISKGNTLYVGGTGPGNYIKIQDAINDAVDGDTVFVYNGTYYENIEVDKSINLIGEDKNTTIIDGSNKSSVVLILVDNVLICEFLITNCGSAPDDSGISIFANNIKINKNKIISNEVGVYTSHSTTNNVISYNNISNNSKGILQEYSKNSTITKNIFLNNTYGVNKIHSNNSIILLNNFLKNYIGIRLYLSNSINVTNNNIRYSHYSGIEVEYSNDNIFKKNDISLNKMLGIDLFYSSNNVVMGNNITLNIWTGLHLSSSTKNIIKGNNITLNNWTGLHLRCSTKNIIKGNNILNNAYGIRLRGSKVRNDLKDNRFNGSNFNLITKNNFNNKINALFYRSFLNFWRQNYWSEQKSQIKLIFGRIGIFGLIPWFNIDWRPAKEPYDIGV